LGEYTTGGGFNASATNSIVSNLKKPVSLRGQPQYYYKERDITQVSNWLRAAIRPQFLEVATIVPMPPSCCKDDPEYDDRMVRIARGTGCRDVRELLVQTVTIPSFHSSGQRRSVSQLIQNWEIDQDLVAPTPQVIVILDDVLTTGAHFKAAVQMLGGRFENVRMVGVFYARRILADSEL